ncbi:TPA: hypothetical protein P0E04_002815 [Vibrio campbellii]|nr:hypothetical protein [Vibrio campbellii]
MKRTRKVGPLMHKLLIENEMDGFSVVELRDAACLIDQDFSDLNLARRLIYRQILRFIKNNWLRSEGAGKQKRYFQTEQFRAVQEESKLNIVGTECASKFDYSILVHERNQSRGELEIVFGEINEYQSLNERFPELVPMLTPHFKLAKERSAQLLGKINVLTNAINVLTKGDCVKC